MAHAGVRARFEDARRARKRLDEIDLMIMYGLDDWKPEGARKGGGTSDPTAAKAIREVDEVAPMLEELGREREELLRVVGEALVLIDAVREGLGFRYSQVLDALYIEAMTWREIRQELGVPKSSGQVLRDVACDWLDSVGVSRALKGETEV